MKKYVFFSVLLLVLSAGIFSSCKGDVPQKNSQSSRFAVNYLFDETKGNLTVKVDGKVVSSGELVNANATVKFKAEPKDGYIVDYWKMGKDKLHKGENEWSTKVTGHINVLLYFKVKPKVCTFSYLFDEAQGTLTAQKEIDGQKTDVENNASLEAGTKLILTASPKADYYVAGWQANGVAVNDRKESYEFEIADNTHIKLIFSNIKYEEDQYFVDFKIDAPIDVPIKVDDSKKDSVKASFAIAKYELTYDIWYKVYMWAIENGYTFANAGIAGSKGENPSDAENTDANKSPRPARLEVGDERQLQPVTKISWRDAIVWCNAYSQKSNLEPYYKHNGQVLKDATAKTDGINFDTDFIDDQMLEGTGYRLPYGNEWEAASRFSLSQDNVVLEGGNPVTATVNGKTAYFTKGNSASGARAAHNNLNESKRVAWFDQNSGEGYNDKGQTHIVATKAQNDLGLFDMAGNVYELVTEKYKDDPVDKTKRIRRGGAWWFNSQGLQVGSRLSAPCNAKNDFVGFRLAKTLGNAPKNIEIEKVILDTTEYTEAGLLGGKKLSLLTTGNEELTLNKDSFSITVSLKSPKDAKVTLKIDNGAEEKITGSAGVFTKASIALTEEIKTFFISISKEGYSTKNYTFKAQKNAVQIPSIPENVKIQKLYVSTSMSNKGQPRTSEANLTDYNLTFPAGNAENDLYLWIRAEEREARFCIKDSSESKQADGKERLDIGELPKSGESKTIVITVSHEGQEFNYNLNIKVE